MSPIERMVDVRETNGLEYFSNNLEINNNSKSESGVGDCNPASPEELALLAKLEQANKLIESDSKFPNNGHSRRGSDTSQISLTSASSSNLERGEGDGEDDLWTIWGRIVNDWDNYNKKKNNYVKELVRKGIPHHFRGIAWQLLCGAHDSPVKKLYADYIKSTSACEKVIRRDIARTYPEHEFFKEKDGLGQESLFNVMKAYSLHDREVGYCQGSGFIVGLLLMQMPEEETFAVFVKLMQDYKMRDMFKPTMAELGLCMYQLENLVQQIMPDLHVHFQSQNFHTSMYASSWFLTLFTTALALPTACRIIDVFLSEGITVLFQVAMALLHLGKEQLLSQDMEGMLKYFQKELPTRADADPEMLMQIAYNMKFNAKKMKKFEKEYAVIKSKEQEEMVELRKLRSENRMLRQRVELLEAESSELADRLVRGQVSKAEEEETVFVVQRELAVLRHAHLDTLHMLENAHEEIKDLAMKLAQQNYNSCQSSLEESSIKEQLSQKEDIIDCLQVELVKVRLKEAENTAVIRDLREKIEELEQDKKRLRESTVDNSVAHLQEELIAVKLREAEANLSLKELRLAVNQINDQWMKHKHAKKSEQPVDPLSTPKKIGNLLNWNNNDAQHMEEELMTTRLKEIEATAELKELRLKVMELETQVQVSGNQLRRQDAEGKVLREKLEKAEGKVKDLASKFREQQHKYADLESKMKDDLMMARIEEAERTQLIAELKQKISRLELENEEMFTQGELRSNVNADDSARVKDLQNRVVDLKAERFLSPTTPDVEPWKWLG